MTLDSAALDRHITGNYGEDQYAEKEPICVGPHDLAYLGRQPIDYDDPDSDTVRVYACRRCGDLYDRRYCEQPMRTGECVLDLNHRGRHTTVGFYCDGCGTMRRGQPETQARNPWDGVPEASFCFMCVRVKVAH